MTASIKWIYDYKRSVLPKHAAGRALPGNQIVLEPHASTRTRLHEYAHVTQGHLQRGVAIGDLIGRMQIEIEAEKFAHTAMGKSATLKMSTILTMASALLVEGRSPQAVYSAILHAYRNLDIKIPSTIRFKLLGNLIKLQADLRNRGEIDPLSELRHQNQRI